MSDTNVSQYVDTFIELLRQIKENNSDGLKEVALWWAENMDALVRNGDLSQEQIQSIHRAIDSLD